ncbi:hypothetical protein EB061_11450, partial [bacterium]|nr:hypothetical protein [bacterium]
VEPLSPGEARSDPAKNRILPYGHTLGPWPTHFRGEPIVTRLTYLKGPPKKFLETIALIWSPVDAEISLLGPKTVLPEFKLRDWKDCFQKSFLCSGPRKAFWNRVFPERSAQRDSEIRASWFESGAKDGPSGVHLSIRKKTGSGGESMEDRFAVITPAGVVQVLSIHTSGNPIGSEARGVFMQTIGALKVHDDLAFGRAWIAGDLKQIDLQALQRIEDPKERFLRLIEVQNLIFAHLSVDPTTLDPFFHLAGVTHRLALDLLHSKEHWFRNQESWLNEFPALLAAIAKYSRDYPANEAVSSRIEALLQDFLLAQRRQSRSKGQ